MYKVLMVVEIFISIFLIIVVLMQASKGGGLAGSFGGSNIGTVFGVRRASDFLSKSTTVLATIFVLLAMVINFMLPTREGETRKSVIEIDQPRATVPTTPQPSVPPQQQTPPAQQNP
ncbi:MAG TPA: preprotein translocase subunit SecG [Bacteroidota bacterium]|nr:preprotein translocase subunit SecG [Bacteroidota bacterium]